MGTVFSCAADRNDDKRAMREGWNKLPNLPTISNPFDKTATASDKYLDSLETHIDSKYPALDKATDRIKPVLKVLVKLICCIAPLYKFLFQVLYVFYYWAPKSLVQMVIGLSLCFFGGQYLMVLAAIEAWNNTGGKDTMNNLKIVYEEGSKLMSSPQFAISSKVASPPLLVALAALDSP